MVTSRRLKALWFAVLFTSLAVAQQPQPGQPTAAPGQVNQPQVPAELPADSIRPNYVLGPNDQFLIRAPGVEEINDRPFRIDAEGFVNFPLIGRLRVGGLTQQQLEAELIKRLREYIVNPQVIVTMSQFRSEPVFFVGQFSKPGIYPLQGRRTLVEMLSSIGGLQANASRHIKVTRRAEYGTIPLPNAIDDPEKKISSVEIGMGSLRENVNPAEDIVLQPFDVVSVERAELVYINGEVGKVGGIELGERESVSIAQALTMAGGFSRDASRGKVRILRPILNTDRRAAIEVDANRVLEGKENDVPLLPNDVLFVPRSYSRTMLTILGSVSLAILTPFIYLAVR